MALVSGNVAVLTWHDEGGAGGGGDGGHLVGGVAEVEPCVGGGRPVDHQLSLADASCQDRAGGWNDGNNNNTNNRDNSTENNSNRNNNDHSVVVSTHFVLSAARVQVTLGAGLPSATHWMLTVSLRSASTRSGTDRFSGASVKTKNKNQSNNEDCIENKKYAFITSLSTM